MQANQQLDAPEYQLIRSTKRKTISLQVKGSKVRVLAPTQVCQKEITRLVSSKAAWLWRKIEQQQQVLKDKNIRDFSAGEVFYYLGTPYQLNVTLKAETIQSVTLDPVTQTINIYIPLRNPCQVEHQLYLKQLLQYWFIEQANLVLSERIAKLQKSTGITMQSLKIRHYKSRWGSCDSRHRINLNWLLIMAPLTVIDYVIIHELCHIKHLNHSAKFWQLVEKFYPSPDSAKAWLTQHQAHLYWI